MTGLAEPPDGTRSAGGGPGSGGLASAGGDPDPGGLASAAPGTAPDRCPVCAAPLGPPLFSSPDRLHGTPGRFSVAPCTGCGLGATLPVVVDSAELAGFYPSAYNAYSSLPRGLLGLVSAAIRRLQCRRALRTPPLADLASMAPGRLLDVGCGRGDLGTWFIARGWSVVGVEPSSEACALARSRGLDARVGTLSDVALEPGSFDAVVFRQSLEHVLDPLADLSRAHALLRPGGKIAVSVPNFGCFQSRRFGARWFHLDVPRHRFHFDASSLRAALAAASFSEIALSTSTSSVGLPGSLQYRSAGRFILPWNLPVRVAAGACVLTLPFSLALDRLTGGGDMLHAVAVKGVSPE
jgi:2-polyprenyl-3-methyl-5-hydroxy-6-metoxy-1,4-benzoquinol methylase